MKFSTIVMQNVLSLNAIIEDFAVATGIIASILDANGHQLSTPLPLEFFTHPLWSSHPEKQNSHNQLSSKKHIIASNDVYKSAIIYKTSPIYNQEVLVGYIVAGNNSSPQDNAKVKLASAFTLLKNSIETFLQSIGAFDANAPLLITSPTNTTSFVPSKDKTTFDYEQLSEIHPSIQSAIAYISKHINESLTLDEVSHHVFLSNCYFSKLFKKEMFTTFIVYVNDKKIQCAKESLKNSEVPIQEISRTLGFAQTSYFSKIFKKHVEMTPSEFRQQSVNNRTD